ncbi:MAG: DUF2231 domain-containing protein [Candidatus Thermoplasmatota archaeon]
MSMPSLLPPAIHPILVHFPIVLLPAAAILATFRNRLPWAAQATPLALVVAAVGALAAMVFGILEHEPWEELLNGTPQQPWLDNHKILGVATATVTTLLAFAAWRSRTNLFAGRRGSTWTLALWAATALVALTAWYGGALVHET